MLLLFVLNESTHRTSKLLYLSFRSGLFQKSSMGKTEQVSPLFKSPTALTKTSTLR